MHADLREYRQLDLRAHSLLADIPLHDVWLLELDGGGEGRTIEDVRRCFTPQTVTTANVAVRTLFAIRRGLGRMFGWDKSPEHWDDELYVHRLTDEDRARSLVPPGTEDGLMRIVITSYSIHYTKLYEMWLVPCSGCSGIGAKLARAACG